MTEKSDRIAAASGMFLANQSSLKKTGDNRKTTRTKSLVIQDTLETTDRESDVIATSKSESEPRETQNPEQDLDNCSRLDLLG